MPEGDAVRRTAQRLDGALAGEALTHADLRWPSVATAGGSLRGRATLEVVSYGKHLLHRLEGGLTLHTHLRMDGSWRVLTRVQAPTTLSRWPDVRVLLGTTTMLAVGLRLGMVDVVRTPEERRLVGHLGPDVLATPFDADLATANLVRSGDPIAQALLDQRNLAGVGTIWASESLYAERLPPWRHASADATARVVAATHRLMTAAMTGKVEHRVHGRSGRPCLRCGSTVRVAMAGPPTRERTIFYCPVCQGGLAPTDDGRPQAPLGAGRRAYRPGEVRRPRP